MSPSIRAASIPVQWCAQGTANHVHTYVHVHGPHSLVPVAGWRRRPSPPASHLAAGATAAWRLIRVSFQAICCVAAGSRRVCYIIRCTFGREVTPWAAALHSSKFPVLACLPCIPAAAAVSRLALLLLILKTLLHTLPAVSLAASPQQGASIDALAHKRNQPSPTLADGLISRTDSFAHGLMDTPSQIPTAKA